MTMASSLITSAVPTLTESALGKIRDSITPIFRRWIKSNKDAQLIIEAGDQLQHRFEPGFIVLLDNLEKSRLFGDKVQPLDEAGNAILSEGQLGQLKDLLTPILKRGIRNEERMDLLLTYRGMVLFEHFLAELLVDLVLYLTTNYTFALTVDYGRIYEKSCFPSVGRNDVAKVELVLMKFNRKMSERNMRRKLQKSGHRWATHLDLDAFSEEYPDLLTPFLVVGLGSHVPAYWASETTRVIASYKNWDGKEIGDRFGNIAASSDENHEWGTCYYFAVVRDL